METNLEELMWKIRAFEDEHKTKVESYSTLLGDKTPYQTKSYVDMK